MATVTPDVLWVARLKLLTAWDQRPVLTEPELVSILQAHPLPDSDGVTASEAAWTQTWDTNAAAAEAWSVKAGRVAGDFNFAADNARYDKGEVMAHCLAMEAKYASMAMGSTATSRGYYDPLSGVVVNG